jgi:hypothetical protein
METIVISFGHKMRHGKDTAIAAIVANRADKYDVRRYAFANPLKQEVNEGAEKAGGMEQFITQLRSTHKLPEWVTYDPNPDMSDPLCPLGKQRTLLQWWGTEYRRASDSYYWVKKLYRTIQQEKPQIALIADMRFRNEFNWVTSLDGRNVKVTRHGFDNGASSHPSEIDLDGVKFDYEILVNDGELDQLKKDALTVFDLICEEFTTPDAVADVDEFHKAIRE